MDDRHEAGEAPLPSPSRADRHRLAEEGSGLIGTAIGLGLTALLIANRDDPVDQTSRILGALALGFLYTLPGALALLGRRRPALYLAAGVLGVLLSFTSFALVTLPLLVPVGMALVAYGRRSADVVPRVPAPVIALHVLALGVASYFVGFLMHEDPRCQTIGNGTECSSDVVTTAEALVSLGVTGIAVASSWLMAGPKDPESNGHIGAL